MKELAIGDKVRYGDKPMHVGVLECIAEPEGARITLLGGWLNISGQARIRRDAQAAALADGKECFWVPIQTLVLIDEDQPK